MCVISQFAWILILILLVPGQSLPFTLVETNLFQIYKFNTHNKYNSTFFMLFCATSICRTYNFLFFKPQSHIHDVGPSRAKIHPDLSNNDASILLVAAP